MNKNIFRLQFIIFRFNEAYIDKLRLVPNFPVDRYER